MSALRKVDIDPRMASNSVLAALLAKLGYEAQPVTPELQERRKRLIALLKFRGREAEEQCDAVEQCAQTGPVPIDWTKPLLWDGYPLVYKPPTTGGGLADIYREDGDKIAIASVSSGGVPLTYRTVCIDPSDQDHLGWPHHPDLRDKITNEGIDWDRPIEFIDGTPASVRRTDRSGDCLVVVDGEDTMRRLATELWGGCPTAEDDAVWLTKRGQYYGDAGERIVIRNRATAKPEPGKIDWTKPIETVDGKYAEYLGVVTDGVTQKSGALAHHVRVELLSGGGHTGKYYDDYGHHIYEKYPDIRNVATAIDWTKPIEFIDGTPAVVRSLGTERHEVAVEDGNPKTMRMVARALWDGLPTWEPDQVRLRKDGSYATLKEGYEKPVVRNRKSGATDGRKATEKSDKIDWSKPIELMDGTPLVLTAKGWCGGPNPDRDGDYWFKREDGAAILASQMGDGRPVGARMTFAHPNGTRKKLGGIDGGKAVQVVRNRSKP